MAEDQYPDDEGYTDQYADQPQAGGYNAKLPDERFLNEQLIKNSLLCETEIKPQNLSWIDIQSLSYSCIQGWRKIWISLFDNSKILSLLSAKTFSAFESKLRARLIMNLNRVGYETFDLDNPVVLTLPMQTELDYMHYLSRGTDGLENALQHKFTVAQESTNTQIIKDARQKEKKPGRLFGLMPGE